MPSKQRRDASLPRTGVIVADRFLVAKGMGVGEEIRLKAGRMVRTFEIDRALYITGAPKAFNGKVLIGNGGTEAGPTHP